VFILPTLIKSEIFANSIAKAGVSIILSLRTLEHLLELYKALTYKSAKLSFVVVPAGNGLVKTLFGSEKI
jgi:hypothetical protein